MPMHSATPGLWSARTRGYAMFMICCLSTLNFVDRQILNILLESIKHDIHASDTRMGLLSGVAFAAFYVTAGIPLARAADTGNRRTLLSLCLGLWSLMTVLSGFARNFAHLALARIGVAIGEAGAVPISQSLMGDICPPGRRGRAQGYFMAAQALGIAGGLFLGGWLNQHFGWRWVFVLVGAPGIALAILIRLTVPEPLRGMADGTTGVVPRKEGIADAVRGMMRIRSSCLLLIGMGCNAFTAYAVLNWAAAYLIRSEGLTTTQVGSSMGLSIVGGMFLGTIAVGFIMDHMCARDMRWGPFIAGLGALCTVPATLLFVSATTAGTALFWFFFFNLACSAVQTPVYAMLITLNRADRRATVTFFASFLVNVMGLACGPLAVGMISDLLTPRFGPAGLGYGMGLSVIGSALACALMWRSTKYVIADIACPSR